MSNHTYTREDAEQYIERSLRTLRSDFDVEAIADELYEVHQSWDMDDIDGDTFWNAVERHDVSSAR